MGTDSETSTSRISELIEQLDSIVAGEVAIDALLAVGPSAIRPLAEFLIVGKPRTISLPRCRAARALGSLGSCENLVSYFQNYRCPHDPAVLFAEDAVRSTVAEELLGWRTESVYNVLCDAARQRATAGLIYAVGQFDRPESLPLLFDALEDDLCRDQAETVLRVGPETTREYALRTLHNLTETHIEGAAARFRLRAILQLLAEVGVPSYEWTDLARFLGSSDPDVVIAMARIGTKCEIPSASLPLVNALLGLGDGVNWFQESEVIQLLEAHLEVAQAAAERLLQQRMEQRPPPTWLSPSWRILNRICKRNTM